jgi:2-methylcitrate dehydratase PrpD
MVHVTVTLHDGTTLKETVEAPRGSEQSFATAEDVIAKFTKLASRRIPPAQVDAITDQVMHAENLESAASLAHLLAAAV